VGARVRRAWLAAEKNTQKNKKKTIPLFLRKKLSLID
jgi:hypothetical protein